MKKISILLCLAVSACATQPSTQQSLEAQYEPIRSQLMADLDDPRHTRIQPSADESSQAVCGSPKTLTCLQITQEICHKIYTKEFNRCVDKKRLENESFDHSEPFNTGYLQGCAAGGTLKYGSRGILSSLECIRSK